MNLRPTMLAALLTATAFAADSQPAAQAAPGGTPASERRICRVTPTIGTRLGGTRTCRTKAEWDAADRENREAVNRYQRTPSACMMGPNDPRLGGGPHLVCSN